MRLGRQLNDHNLGLSGNPESLAALGEKLDLWNFEASHYVRVGLSNEVGVYLGNVIVQFVEGSRWTVWPNGYLVSLALDVR